MWDERYRGAEYLFGTAPAAFLDARAGVIAAGSQVLCVADGEGRNSTWLAQQGHHVDAMDGSSVALEKASALAKARGVTVRFHLADIAAWDWPEAAFDAVVGIFIQFASPLLRAQIHAGMARALRPGGLVLLHGYAPRQIENGTGGPRQVENLYTIEGLKADFAGWDVLRAADYDAIIREGRGHSGKSALVDFIARKPPMAAAGALG